MVEIQDNTKQFMARAETAAEKAVAIIVGKAAREARRLVNQHSSPPPSVSPQPPHKRTGALGASIRWTTTRDSDGFSGRFGTNLRYGFWLELGTVRMGPRPFIRPVLDRIIQKDFTPELRRTFQAEVGGASLNPNVGVT